MQRWQHHKWRFPNSWKCSGFNPGIWEIFNSRSWNSVIMQGWWTWQLKMKTFSLQKHTFRILSCFYKRFMHRRYSSVFMWRNSHVKPIRAAIWYLVCCMMRTQNAVQTWQLMDSPHKYVRYRYPVHVICETWAHWLLLRVELRMHQFMPSFVYKEWLNEFAKQNGYHHR